MVSDDKLHVDFCGRDQRVDFVLCGLDIIFDDCAIILGKN